MEWNKDTLRKARTLAKFSQQALANELGVHWRTIQNWESGVTPIPTSALASIDMLLGTNTNVISIEEYNKVVEALNSATELNKKLTEIIQSSLHKVV